MNNLDRFCRANKLRRDRIEIIVDKIARHECEYLSDTEVVIIGVFPEIMDIASQEHIQDENRFRLGRCPS